MFVFWPGQRHAQSIQKKNIYRHRITDVTGKQNVLFVFIYFRIYEKKKVINKYFLFAKLVQVEKVYWHYRVYKHTLSLLFLARKHYVNIKLLM